MLVTMEEIERREIDKLLPAELGPLLYSQEQDDDDDPPQSLPRVDAPTMWRDPGYSCRAFLLVAAILMALLGAIVFAWQICVLSGRANENPDGTVDDWHEQKILFGIAVADIFLSCPMIVIGAALVLVQENSRIGHFLLIMTSFWFVWTNTAFTVTSLRFEKPEISLEWFIVFPFGILVGLLYIIWILFNFDKIFVVSGGYETIP